MILYLDTSSLIKLYIDESGTPEVIDLVGESSLVCTSVVAYPEARSALARLHREGDLTGEAYAQAKSGLEEDWAAYLASSPSGMAFEASTVFTSHPFSRLRPETLVNQPDSRHSTDG